MKLASEDIEMQENMQNNAIEEKSEDQLLREAEDAERAKKAKIAAIWDKITTGLLIFLMASPFLVLLYIFLWFTSGL